MTKTKISDSTYLYENGNGRLLLAYPSITKSERYEISNKAHAVIASEDSHAMAEIRIGELLAVRLSVR